MEQGRRQGRKKIAEEDESAGAGMVAISASERPLRATQWQSPRTPAPAQVIDLIQIIAWFDSKWYALFLFID
jgi:hypothetical protein